MAELVKLRTTWCGKVIVVAEIGEKAAEPRSGSVILEKVATFGPQSPHALTKCTHVFARPLGEDLRRDKVSRGIVCCDHVGHNNIRRQSGDGHFIQKCWLQPARRDLPCPLDIEGSSSASSSSSVHPMPS